MTDSRGDVPWDDSIGVNAKTASAKSIACGCLNEGLMMEKDEVITATRLWVEKAVIGLNLCPFAKAVYVKNQVRFVVSEARHVDGFLEDLDRELDFLAAADPAETDTTLLIHPTLLPDFMEFNDFMVMAEGAVGEHGLEGVIQIASFHPAYQFADTEPDDIGNYTNRAPFPTLHLIREESLSRAVDSFPDVDGIYERNIETLKKLGLSGWQALGLSNTKSAKPGS
jgi:hypothetical protein